MLLKHIQGKVADRHCDISWGDWRVSVLHYDRTLYSPIDISSEG